MCSAGCLEKLKNMGMLLETRTQKLGQVTCDLKVILLAANWEEQEAVVWGHAYLFAQIS